MTNRIRLLSLGIFSLFCPHVATAQTNALPPAAPAADAFKVSWEVEPFGGGGAALGGKFRSNPVVLNEPSFLAPGGGQSVLSFPTWFLPEELESGRPPLLAMQSLAPFALGPGLAVPTLGVFGVRVTRWGTPHLGIQLGASFTPGTPSRFSSAALADVEASSASFVSALDTLFGASPTLYGTPRVSATTSRTASAAAQVQLTAALVVTKANGRARPYITLGGGELAMLGGGEAVNVTGHYTFTAPGGAPIDETDSVTLHHSYGHTGLLAFGGGVRLMARARAGIRVDLSMTTGKDRDAVTVDLNPLSTPGTPPGFVFQPGTRNNEPIVFSNTSSQQTSLSGSPASHLLTAAGSGWRRNWALTAGWFWGF